jgi:psiF repeat
MKKIFIAIAVTLPLSVAFVSTTASAASTRAEARTMCTKDSAAMKGAERKAFMKDCMAKNAPPKKAPSAQNLKMKSCSADFKATGKPSSERRAFMSSCMKK